MACRQSRHHGQSNQQELQRHVFLDILVENRIQWVRVVPVADIAFARPTERQSGPTQLLSLIMPRFVWFLLTLATVCPWLVGAQNYDVYPWPVPSAQPLNVTLGYGTVQSTGTRFTWYSAVLDDLSRFSYELPATQGCGTLQRTTLTANEHACVVVRLFFVTFSLRSATHTITAFGKVSGRRRSDSHPSTEQYGSS
jgi:hypothetical protein